MTAGSTSELSCHELLLRLAGRLPDRQLWRYRDWLAGGAHAALASALPTSLLTSRIGLTAAEFGLLTDALVPAGADPSVLSVLTEIPDSDECPYTFTPVSAQQSRLGDPVPGLLVAVLGQRRDLGAVYQSWRRPLEEHDQLKRVLLVDGADRLVGLTGELQRLLRALGDGEPSVEVLGKDTMIPAYQREALDAATPICAGSGTHAARDLVG